MKKWIALAGLLALISFNADSHEIIVKLKRKSTLNTLRGLLKKYKLQKYVLLVPEMRLVMVDIPNLYRADSVSKILNYFRREGLIEYAQYNHPVRKRSDGIFDMYQWSMNGSSAAGIGATQAWKYGKGGKTSLGHDIVVGVVDGGFDLNHQDLVRNIWVNRAEIPNNGKDDDGNGFVDDVNGWNAYQNNGKIPSDSHGTHVAGIIGANGGSERSIRGVNWNVKMMMVAGSTNKTDVITKAYGYIIRQKLLWLKTKGKKGANVVVTNSSFGIDRAKCNTENFALWNDLYEQMGKIGILSAAATTNGGYDVDKYGDVPTGCPSDFIIGVGNIGKSFNSRGGWGKKHVDLHAQGYQIYSTVPGNQYDIYSGTSMATPHVAGAVAFLHSVASPSFSKYYLKNPAKGAIAIKKILMKNVTKNSNLKDKNVTSGVLNLAKSVQGLREFEAYLR